jgi:hypothetical protein
MMNELGWINREECLVLHKMMLLRYGGVAGVRDSALLDAVVARPKERFVAGVAGLPEPSAQRVARRAIGFTRPSSPQPSPPIWRRGGYS